MDAAEDSDETAAPTISVVLPVHNGERFLRAALDSILAQTLTDFELIAVDDCSTDSTPSILAEYANSDSRIRVLTNPDNRKLPASLNRGFAEARADWLTWTSDDNLMLPETLERLGAARRDYPQADIIHADYRVIDEHGSSSAVVETGPASRLLLDNTIGCCFLYRREVDERLGGYDEDLFGVEDYDFWLRAAAAGFTFHRIAQPLYLYRRHEGSLTDMRARSIHALVHERLIGEVHALENPRERAKALVRLATRDAYTLRPALLFHALRDSPVAVVGEWRTITRWLRRAATLRLARR